VDEAEARRRVDLWLEEQPWAARGGVRARLIAADGAGWEYALGGDEGVGRRRGRMTWAVVDSVLSLAFSPDGERLATGASDGRVRVWSTRDGALLATGEGHAAEVWALAFSPDGSRLVSGSDDRTARVWDPDDGRPLATLTGHEGLVRDVAVSPDGRHVATAGERDRTFRVWELASGREVVRLRGGKGAGCLAFTPDGARLVGGGYDGDLFGWDWAKRRRLARHPLGEGLGAAACLTGEPTAVVGGLADRLFFVELARGEVTRRFRLRGGGGQTSVSHCEATGRIATGHMNGELRLWDGARGARLATVRAHEAEFGAQVAWSADGALCATASGDNTARVFDADDLRERLVLRPPSHAGSPRPRRRRPGRGSRPATSRTPRASPGGPWPWPRSWGGARSRGTRPGSPTPRPSGASSSTGSRRSASGTSSSRRRPRSSTARAAGSRGGPGPTRSGASRGWACSCGRSGGATCRRRTSSSTS